MSNNYQIGSGLSDKELAVSSWWVRHQLQLRMLGYGTLAVAIVGLWGYAAWSVLDAYIISYQRESQIPAMIAQNQLAQGGLTQTTPEPVQASSVLVFQNTDGRKDILVQISNSNPQWWTELTYKFRIGSEETPERKGYILPSSQRYLAESGWKGQGASASAAELEITDMRWHRIDPLQVKRDYTAFAAERLRFQIEEPSYASDLSINGNTVGQSSFVLRNASGYGFWGVDLTIILTRLGTPIGVTTLNAREIKPGEARSFTVHWFENMPSNVSETNIYADVNILDQSVYLPSTRF